MRRSSIIPYIIFSIVLLTAPTVRAAFGSTLDGTQGIEASMAAWAQQLIFFASAIILLLIFIAILIDKKSELLKRILFDSMVVVVCAATIVLVYNTVFLNTHSWTKGPVHWHADYQVWACDEPLDLVDPSGFSNKIGTATLHEHNDNRIHVEGVVVTPSDVTLGKYFSVIGGYLDPETLMLPTTEGSKSYKNGDTCADGSSGIVQAFVYTVNADKTFSQRKVRIPDAYILSGESQVPPGDCIIVVFGPDTNQTNHICESYSAGLQTGKLVREVYDNETTGAEINYGY